MKAFPATPNCDIRYGRVLRLLLGVYFSVLGAERHAADTNYGRRDEERACTRGRPMITIDTSILLPLPVEKTKQNERNYWNCERLLAWNQLYSVQFTHLPRSRSGCS